MRGRGRQLGTAGRLSLVCTKVFLPRISPEGCLLPSLCSDTVVVHNVKNMENLSFLGFLHLFAIVLLGRWEFVMSRQKVGRWEGLGGRNGGGRGRKRRRAEDLLVIFAFWIGSNPLLPLVKINPHFKSSVRDSPPIRIF